MLELVKHNPENSLEKMPEPQIIFNGDGAGEMFNHWAKLKDGVLHFPFSDFIKELDCRGGLLIVNNVNGTLRMTLEMPDEKPLYLEFDAGAVQINEDQYYGENE